MPTDKTTIKGTWWQANQPDKRLQGEVTYGPLSGAEVDLFGHFENSLDFERPAKRFTLHGLTYKDKPITLFDCLISDAQRHFPGQASSEVSTVSGIVGGHYQSPGDIKFKQVTASFTNLREWVWTTGLTMAPRQDSESISATYRLPPAIPLGRFGPLVASIKFSVHDHPRFHSLTIEQDCAVLIEADSMQPYDLFQDCLDSFQQFLTLAVQYSAYSTRITGRIDQPREIIADSPLYEDYLIIRSRSTAEPQHPACIPQHFLFTSHELTSTPAEAFTRFVDRQEKLGAAMDLYFTTIHHKFHLPRVLFLTLAQSLEAYHRATQPGRYVTDETYHNGLRRLLWDAIPKDDQTIGKDFLESLDTKLNYLHEFSLRKRLKELAAKHRAILEHLIGTPEAFSSAVAGRRNQLTHANEQNRSAADDFRTLCVLCDKMALLLEVCFLDEIGFTHDRLKQIVTTRSKRARWVHQGWV